MGLISWYLHPDVLKHGTFDCISGYFQNLARTTIYKILSAGLSLIALSKSSSNCGLWYLLLNKTFLKEIILWIKAEIPIYHLIFTLNPNVFGVKAILFQYFQTGLYVQLWQLLCTAQYFELIKLECAWYFSLNHAQAYRQIFAHNPQQNFKH